MWSSLFVVGVYVSFGLGCAEVDQPNESPAAPAAPRILSTPARQDAIRVISNPTFPPDQTPPYVFHGWRLAIVNDSRTWAAFATAAGWKVGDFQVDFDREVLVFAAHYSGGGLLSFLGWSVGADGRAVFRYGPAVTFGPAWLDAGALVLGLAVPREGLRSVDFVNGERRETTIKVN